MCNKKLFWQALTSNQALASQIDNRIATEFNNLPADSKDYTSFVAIANKVGSELLPPKPPAAKKTVDSAPVSNARKETLRASTRNVQSAQTRLRATYNTVEDKRITDTLRFFKKNPAAHTDTKNAWKELSGKRTRSTIFIEGEDRLTNLERPFPKSIKCTSNSRHCNTCSKCLPTV